MPRRPNTPCKHPGCGRLVPYGTMYCEEHKPLAEQVSTIDKSCLMEKKGAVTDIGSAEVPV